MLQLLNNVKPVAQHNCCNWINCKNGLLLLRIPPTGMSITYEYIIFFLYTGNFRAINFFFFFQGLCLYNSLFLAISVLSCEMNSRKVCNKKVFIWFTVEKSLKFFSEPWQFIFAYIWGSLADFVTTFFWGVN